MAPSGATVGSGTKRIEVENMEVFKETVELISLYEDLTYKTRLTNDETTQKPWSMEEQVWSESERKPWSSTLLPPYLHTREVVHLGHDETWLL
uniref:Uncharacterized protein n=1 Tax=Oryza meridionalis TaxID=40149 RepID=A0A0E0EB17_9ORYZ